MLIKWINYDNIKLTLDFRKKRCQKWIILRVNLKENLQK